MRVRYTARALLEIEHIQDYIAERNPAAAFEMAERIRGSIVTLEDHPRKGRHGRVPGTRELVVTGTPYVVTYRVRSDTVVILAVLHGAQRWPDRL